MLRHLPSAWIRCALASGFALAATASWAGEPLWISLGDDAYRLLRAQQPQVVSVTEVALPVTVGRFGARVHDLVHVVRVDEDWLPALSDAVHRDLHRCGGFVVHDSLGSARAAVQRVRELALQPEAVAGNIYQINQQALVQPMVAAVQDSLILQTIDSLSAIQNRYYTTTHGVTASNTIAAQWTALAAGRSDVTVSQFTHPSWPQKSVILTIQGTKKPDQHVVLGGHMDSILSGGMSENSRAPGADDDASGIASLTEALRVLLASGHRPKRTIQFMAYAAEEVGLRGSSAIAADYLTKGRKVTGVLQLDMTNYKGGTRDIYLFTDYTSATQNDFVSRLASTYLPDMTVSTSRCGYACSDHASWNNRGFPASFPFEADFSHSNPFIHSVNDTLANSGNQAAHAGKFAKLAVAYAVELAN